MKDQPPKLTLTAALRGTPAADVLALTELVYRQVRHKVAAGHGTADDIRACNDARKVIKSAKQAGV